jgi:hypothetical protein
MGIQMEMRVFRMVKVVQCKSHCSHAKNIVAVIHVTQCHCASNSFLEAYHITKHKELDEKWAAFFYESNVAFNVLDTLHLLQR